MQKYMTDGNPVPADAQRITFTVYTTGSYNAEEKDALFLGLLEAATDFDDDILKHSAAIEIQTQKQIIVADRAALVATLNSANAEIGKVQVSLRFGEDVDDLLYEVGAGDNE